MPRVEKKCPPGYEYDQNEERCIPIAGTMHKKSKPRKSNKKKRENHPKDDDAPVKQDPQEVPNNLGETTKSAEEYPRAAGFLSEVIQSFNRM